MELKTFYVGVKSAILNDKNQLLLVKSPKGYWELPGGRINDDEDIEQALMRELKEELPNIKNIKIEDLIHTVRMPFNLKDGQGLLLIVYKVNAVFNGNVEISDEHVDAKWFHLEKSEKLLETQLKYVVKILN